MKNRFKKITLSLVMVSVLLSAANGNAGENSNASADSAWRHGHKAPKTQLVSVNSAGTDSGNDYSGGSEWSGRPEISADARFVAFTSTASDLVAKDTNNTRDIFVRDIKTGKTKLVSANRAGADSGNGDSFVPPRLSADGRLILFSSNASDLVSNDINGAFEDAFVRDLKNGMTTLVSFNSAGTGSGNGASSPSALSANNRFVAFISFASDLVANDSNNTRDIYVRDLDVSTLFRTQG